MIGSPGLDVSALWPNAVALYCATLLPLAAGLPPIIAIIESVYVMTGREIWKQAARFWGKLFGVALLVCAVGSIGLTILYVADAGGSTWYIRAIARPAWVGLFLAFMLASGVLLWNWFRDWWNPRRMRHLLVTWLWVPLSGLAVWVTSVGYGLLDNPAGIELDPDSLQVRIHDLPAVLMNPGAQSRFVHLAGACYLVAATLVLSVSAGYLLRDRNVRIARRSFTVAASFGFATALSLAVLGDHSGYATSPGQQMQIAAIAAQWHTQTTPAPFTLFGFPDTDGHTTRAAVDLPWVLGLGATHSWRKSVAGLRELESVNASRIRDGIATLAAQDMPGAGPAGVGGPTYDAQDNPNLGYALLLLRSTPHPAQAGSDEVDAAARSTIPNVPLLFWTFRVMALLGAYSIALFGCAFWLASKRQLEKRVFLKVAAFSLPLPWIAGALGWIVSEAGRGPWLIDGLLPVTVMHASRQEAAIGVMAYLIIAVLFVAGAVLLARFVHVGPRLPRFWPVDSGRKGEY